MFRRFAAADESGAVSADWMALGAGLVGLSIAIVSALSTGTTSLGEASGEALSTAQVSALGTMGWSE